MKQLQATQTHRAQTQEKQQLYLLLIHISSLSMQRLGNCFLIIIEVDVFVLTQSPLICDKSVLSKAPPTEQDAIPNAMEVKSSYLGWNGPHSTAQQFVRILLWL